MPRYDYQCNSCGNEFELTQSFKEAGAGSCPECSGEGRRVFHAVPVIYKGSGFYTTDYGRPKTSTDNGKEEKDSTKDSNKDSSETKSSTKSETKSDSTPATTTTSDSTT